MQHNEQTNLLINNQSDSDLTEYKANLSTLTEEELNQLLTDLTKKSWNLFGLKLTIPFLPLLLVGGSFGLLLTTPKDVSENDQVESIAGSTIIGVAGLGLFSISLKYAYDTHKEQKKVDAKREVVQQNIDNIKLTA